ncbi:sirQ protein [Aspergillus flavus]|uniref:SirQ protein n=1 Tax=Aspergillus flavus TaxID=5059 RepID=A0AB74BSK4_ASPFL|nr:sirQ protein [Aspergillus flavus]
MSHNGRYALVFGASGISGWSLLNQCLSYPTTSSFRRVVGLCNRPLSKKDAYLPDDPRLDIVSRIDLTQSVSSVTDQLKAKVHDVESVEVVLFCAYIEAHDFESRREVNARLLRTAIQAISGIAPNLESVILQTGGKGYGLEFSNELKISPPLHESMPRIPEPWRSKVFYYEQYDTLSELSKGKKWSFSEIRPDGIIGFVPGTNVMNLAQGIALYLTLYREVHGQGAEVPFLGMLHGYRSTHSDTFQDILSKMEIYAALNRDKCPNGSAYNVANGDVVSWEQVWPDICSHFGLVGTGPQGDQKKIEDFVRENRGAWTGLVEKHGLRKGSLEAQNWPFIHFMLVEFDFDREYTLDAARSIGFTERIDTVQGYRVAFDRMAAARIIPSSF